jgi:hypothetical protein
MPKYPQLCAQLDRAKFMSNAIGMCLREVHAVRPNRRSRADRLLLKSATWQAFAANANLGLRFDISRAEPAYLVWTHDIKTRQLCRPFPVAVDWQSGVVRQENTQVLGLLEDVRDCLYTRDAGGEMIPLTAPSGTTIADADPAEAQQDYDTAGSVKPGPRGVQRIGQDWFRSKLLHAWDGRCAVTGCAHPALLKASHIVAWADATGPERLDEANGFLLVATLDAAFDRGIVSFADDGCILISTQLTSVDLVAAGLHNGMRLRRVPAGSLPFLARHRARHGFAHFSLTQATA